MARWPDLPGHSPSQTGKPAPQAPSGTAAPGPGVRIANVHGYPELLVDGRPRFTLLANGPFLAAWLPAGTHRLEAIYRAPGLIAGLMLAALALTGMAAWVVPRPRDRIFVQEIGGSWRFDPLQFI